MAKYPAVTEQMDEIRRDVVEIVPEDELVRKLESSRQTGRPLLVKQGFDPTRPDLHIGHAVSIRKLRSFQGLGHEVVFVVGDYTARVGDPSGRSEARPRLTPAEIEENARTYAEQVGSMLDLSRVRVEFNSRWLAPLDLAALLELTATYTLARMLERDDFAQRYAEGRPISILELLYPLLQAYDSVALRADIEVGGTDQKFNLLVGRTVQERYGQQPQVCLILPLLRGLDGHQKMSKSSDNYIGIAEPPEEQYGKTMSIPDHLLEEWFRLAAALGPDELAAALDLVRVDPYQAKRQLASRVVSLYHGQDAASSAEDHFDRLFRQRTLPADIPKIEIRHDHPALRFSDNGEVWLPGLLVAAGLASSNSDAARLIAQNAISVDGSRADNRSVYLSLAPGVEVLLKRGKRRFVRVALCRPSPPSD